MVTKSLSIEDGNLSVKSIITGRKSDYKDIDLTFEVKGSGDVYKKTDAAAVKQSVKNLILTNKGEKPFQPRFGGDITRLLFDLIDADAEHEITNVIKYAIEAYEPRAKIIDINVNPAPDRNSIDITLVFQVINTLETVTLRTGITRLR